MLRDADVTSPSFAINKSTNIVDRFFNSSPSFTTIKHAESFKSSTEIGYSEMFKRRIEEYIIKAIKQHESGTKLYRPIRLEDLLSENNKLKGS